MIPFVSIAAGVADADIDGAFAVNRAIPTAVAGTLFADLTRLAHVFFPVWIIPQFLLVNLASTQPLSNSLTLKS